MYSALFTSRTHQYLRLESHTACVRRWFTVDKVYSVTLLGKAVRRGKSNRSKTYFGLNSWFSSAKDERKDDVWYRNRDSRTENLNEMT